MARVTSVLLALVGFLLGSVPGYYLATAASFTGAGVIALPVFFCPPLVLAYCAYRKGDQPKTLTKWFLGLAGIYILGIASNLITALVVTSPEGGRAEYRLLPHLSTGPSGPPVVHFVAVPFLLYTEIDHSFAGPDDGWGGSGTLSTSISFFGARIELSESTSWMS